MQKPHQRAAEVAREIEERAALIYRTAAEVMKRGPDRVLVSSDCAVSPKSALMQYRIRPDVVFIRDDGWTLGAPAGLADKAFKLWAGSYVAFMIRPEEKPRPITEFHLGALADKTILGAAWDQPLPPEDWEANRTVCIVHPDRVAVGLLNVPCAPNGHVPICAECRDNQGDEAVMKRIFEAYRAGHSKQIKTYKQVNPGS